MRRALPLAVVALVCLAGCGGLVGDDSSPVPTSTPADVPTDSALTDPPDGLTADGVSNGFDLAAVHSEILDNRSYSVQRTSRLVAANGTTLSTTNSTQRVSDNHERAVSTQQQTGLAVTSGGYARLFNQSVTQVSQWYDGERYIVRVNGPNGTASGPLMATGAPDQQPSRTFQHYYLNAQSETVTSENGTITVHLSGVSGELTVAALPVNVADSTITVTMTADGQVTQSSAEFTGSLMNGLNTPVEGNWTVQYTAVGETTVDRPDWVDDVQNTTTTPD